MNNIEAPLDPPIDDGEERLGRLLITNAVEIDEILDALDSLINDIEVAGLLTEDIRLAREHLADFIRPFYPGFTIRDRIQVNERKRQ